MGPCQRNLPSESAHLPHFLVDGVRGTMDVWMERVDTEVHVPESREWRRWDSWNIKHKRRTESVTCTKRSRGTSTSGAALFPMSRGEKKGLSGETCQITFNMTNELYSGQWRHQACVRSPPAHIRSVVN